MEYDLALKRKEILTQTAARMDLEDVRPGEVASHKGQVLCDSTPVRSLEPWGSRRQTGEGWGRGGAVSVEREQS